MTVELVVTPKSVDHIYELINVGADSFVIGEEKYGLRLAGEFKRDELKKLSRLFTKQGKKHMLVLMQFSTMKTLMI